MTTTAQALKEAKAKQEPGYIKINFGYSSEYVFPYKAGIAILEAFEFAEEIDASQYDNHTIIPVNTGPEIRVVSRKKYVEMKMAHLLGLNIEEKET